MSKFAVVIFREEKKVYEALHALQELHADGSLTLYGTDVVQRDATGKLSILKRDDAGPIGFGVGALLGALVGLFGGPIGGAIGWAAGGAAGGVRDVLRLDVTEEFLEAIERELAPGSFAIVAEIDEWWFGPLDTRMEEFGAKVVREEREAFRDEMIERRVNAAKAELARRKAKHAQRKAHRAAERAGSKAEQKEQMLTAEIDDARWNIQKMAENAETRLEYMKQELNAKIDALQQQAASARPEVRSRIDERIAEIRRELGEREQKLMRAKQLTQEALQP